MSFTSLSFLFFFPIVVLLYYFFPEKMKKYWLLAAGFYFYACLDKRFLLLLIFLIFISYFGGILVDRKKSGTLGQKIGLAVCIAALASALLFFKFNSFIFSSLNILLPVGMSFYILQMIAYLVDIYRGTIRCEKNIIDYGLLMSFFPKIISGPLVKNKEFLEQVKAPSVFDESRVQAGLLMMLLGFFEKIVLAETLAQPVAVIFGNYREMHAFYLVIGAVCYSLYIYCDFSGYSHIAIGAAKAMGVELGDNFRQPYFALSIQDFWHRWHISLSNWLRDYIYIPLGGNRKGRIKKYVNLLLVFLVSGLWHGTGWRYIFWGMLHGTYQIMEDIAGKISHIALWNGIRRIRTFILVTFAWIFFASPSLREGAGYAIAMFTHWNGSIGNSLSTSMGLLPFQLVYLFLSLIALCVIDVCRERKQSLGTWIISVKAPVRWSICLFVCLFIILVAFRSFGQEASNFIYAQF